MTPERIPEVIVNADLARLADPPRSRALPWLAALAFGNVLAAVAALTFGADWPAVALAAGNFAAAVAVAHAIDNRT